MSVKFNTWTNWKLPDRTWARCILYSMVESSCDSYADRYSGPSANSRSLSACQSWDNSSIVVSCIILPTIIHFVLPISSCRLSYSEILATNVNLFLIRGLIRHWFAYDGQVTLAKCISVNARVMAASALTKQSYNVEGGKHNINDIVIWLETSR